MTIGYCFDDKRAEKACGHYVEAGPAWTRWLRQIHAAGFMRVLRANPTGKLAVIAAAPTTTPGLRPQPKPLPNVEDVNDG